MLYKKLVGWNPTSSYQLLPIPNYYTQPVTSETEPNIGLLLPNTYANQKDVSEKNLLQSYKVQDYRCKSQSSGDRSYG